MNQYNKSVLALGKMIMFLHLLRKLNPWQKKIVLIDKSDGLGDIIMWMPFAKRFRERYPADKYEFNVLVYAMNQELIDYLEIADKTIVIPSYKNALQWFLFRIIFWLKNPVDILIAFHYSFSDLMLPYNPDEAISFQHSKVNAPILGKNRIVFPADNLSIYERFPMLLKQIGASTVPDVFDYHDLIQPPPNECPDQNYIVIAPGANSFMRQWEPEKFSTLINELLKKYDYKIVLLGRRKEETVCEQILDRCIEKKSIINLSGRTSVRQLFGVIANADFLISNETGTAHIGGVLGIKTFIISGGGDYGDFVPYPPDKEGKTVFSIFRTDHHCFGCMWQNMNCSTAGKPAPCVADITVEDVLKNIMKTFETENTPVF